MRQPNILFAFADDWGRYAGCYAEPDLVRDADAQPPPVAAALSAHIRTPNMDRLASQGVRFTNAFVPAPTCTPCRSSVLSGRYFWQTGLGAILQGAVWDRSIPSYPLMLEDGGYHIGFTYKVWSPGTPRDDPYGGASRRYEPAGTGFNQYSFTASERIERTGGIEQAKESLDDEVRGNFTAFLDGRRDGPDGRQPFCYWWGPTNTHREWKRGSGARLWGLNPDDLAGDVPPFLPDVPEVREDICDYLGECMAVDRGLGVLLSVLEERGELDSTLVVASGDHGIPGFPRAKCNLYDIGCEVALLARWPAVIPSGRVVDDMVSLMDLAPTFLEAAGIQPPDDMPAKSLLPVMASESAGQVDTERTSVVTGRERHVATAREWNLPYPQRAIRTHQYLYIRNYAPDRWPMGAPRGLDDPTVTPPAYEELEHDTFIAYADLDAGPTKAWIIHNRNEPSVRAIFETGFGKRSAEELYDLHLDPHHMRNRAHDPAYEEVRRRLAGMLEEELVRQSDPRVVEPACRFDRAPFTDASFPDNAARQRLSMLEPLPPAGQRRSQSKI